MIRPDSPTLGFDDEYFAAGAMRQELPEIPPKRNSRQDFESLTPSPPFMPSISEGDELSPTESSSTDDSRGEYPFFQDDSVEPESVRSFARYCATLSSLKTQVMSHTSVLEDILENDLQIQRREQLERAESPLPHDTTSLMMTSFNRMSLNSQGGNRHRSGSSMSLRSAGSVGSGDEEERSKDRQARIDKLRMNGWNRKRFDSTRYEVLCDVVMSELCQA